MAKIQTSTRNPKMNYYYDADENMLYSGASYSATNKYRNVKLLEYNDYIVVSGNDIIKDAENNRQMYGYSDFNPNINTGNINEQNNYYVYGTPHKWVFDNSQQYNNCGIDSVLNVLVMAGKKVITDQNTVETEFTRDIWERRNELGLISIDEDKYGNENGIFDDEDGGTHPNEFTILLADNGVDSTYYDYYSTETTSLEEIAQVIKEGGAAIVGVCDAILWNYKRTNYLRQVNHAIAITGVVYEDAEAQNLVGFYIHDTAAWMTRYITLEDLRNATLYQKFGTIYGAIVPDVKIGTNNTNLNGNKYSNQLFGNNSDNVINGKGGNDTIFGMDGNDTLYGSKGKDTIYGGLGDDKIYGGAGNDTIYDDAGDDYISCGSGTDRIVFNSECGENTLVSSSGTVIIESDEKFDSLVYDTENKTLTLSYDEDNLVNFEGFYNNKTNKCKRTYIADSDDIKTRIYVTNSKGKIKVGDSKTNNILYSLSTKNNTITTSKHNDKVYMYGGNDTIKYTGGNDYYISYSGNNTYNASLFSSDTNLKISDAEGQDRLNINSDKSSIGIFVDYKSTGERNSDNLYIFDKNIITSLGEYSDFLSESSNGYVCIENYFSDGCIEDIRSKAGKTYVGLDIESALNEIQSAVQGWFSDNSGYDSVLDAIAQSESALDLINCYANVNVEEQVGLTT